MRDRIRAVMAATFQLPPEEIPEAAAMDNVPGWDSLGHLELMLALEMEFGVRISTADMAGLASLAEIEAFLVESGVTRAA